MSYGLPGRIHCGGRRSQGRRGGGRDPPFACRVLGGPKQATRSPTCLLMENPLSERLREFWPGHNSMGRIGPKISMPSFIS